MRATLALRPLCQRRACTFWTVDGPEARESALVVHLDPFGLPTQPDQTVVFQVFGNDMADPLGLLLAVGHEHGEPPLLHSRGLRHVTLVPVPLSFPRGRRGFGLRDVCRAVPQSGVDVTALQQATSGHVLEPHVQKIGLAHVELHGLGDLRRPIPCAREEGAAIAGVLF